MLSLLIWCALNHADSLTGPILDVIGHHDITYFAEEHELRDARVILRDVLARGFSSRTIDAFATEYVDARGESAFQAYLVDPAAGPGSAAESAFFAHLASFGFLWTRDSANVAFFRFLRTSKLARPDLRICGMDYQPTTREARDGAVASWPDVLRARVAAHSRLTLEEMRAHAKSGFEREPTMALRTWACVHDARHAVVHVGSAHAWSTAYDPTPYTSPLRGPRFTSSQYVAALAEGRKITTILTALPFAGEADRGMNRVYAKVTAALGRGSRRLSAGPGLPLSVRAVFTLETRSGKTLPLDRVWDYFIVGKAGAMAPIFD